MNVAHTVGENIEWVEVRGSWSRVGSTTSTTRSRAASTPSATTPRRLGLTLDDLRSSQRSPVVVAREALAWVAVVLYGFQVKEVARALDKYVETVSRLVSRAAAKRIEDDGFRAIVNAVDGAVIDSLGER